MGMYKIHHDKHQDLLIDLFHNFRNEFDKQNIY